MKTPALAAKALKQEIKKAFPSLKFAYRSESYSGGSSINIEYTDQPPHVHKTIEGIASKYQYGHFDGMNDIYEYSNRHEDIPQVKYLFCRNVMSPAMREEIKAFRDAHFSPDGNYGYEDKIRGLFTGAYKNFWQSKEQQKTAA